MNFMLFTVKFIRFKPTMKFNKFELHNYDHDHGAFGDNYPSLALAVISQSVYETKCSFVHSKVKS